MHSMQNLLFVLFLAVCWGTVESKEVEVKLQAGWEATPLVAEIAEFLWKEHPSSFWEFIEQCKPEGDIPQEQCWYVLHASAVKGMSSALSRFLGVSSSLRLLSPKVQMRRQLATGRSLGNCCWAEMHVDGSLLRITDPVQLRTVLQKEISTVERDVFDFDFEFKRTGQTVGSTAPLVFFYGAIGSDCFHELHAILKGASEEGRIRYVFRPVFDSKSCSGKPMHSCAAFGTDGLLKIGGFGVELALKSTEYSAMNDASHSADTSTPSPEEEKASVSDLGLQSMQHVLLSNDPLKTFSEMLEDFPSVASSLTKLTVEEGLRDAVENVSGMVSARQEFALLNGLPFRISDFDLIEFLERLRNDLIGREKLRKLHFSDKLTAALLRLRSQDKTEDLEDIRFDILPKDHVVYLNDIEKDAEYRSLPKSLDILFNPFAGRGGLIPIQRNLFNCVFFVDMVSDTGMQLASFIQQVQKQKAPIRIGIVPLFPSQRTVQSDTAGSEGRRLELVRLFLGLYFCMGPKPAFSFWALASDPQKELLPVATSVFDGHRPRTGGTTDAIQAIDAAAPKVDAYLEALHTEVTRIGLHETNCEATLWLNGRLVELEGESFDRTIVHNIQLETRFTQQLAYVGEITDDDKDLLSALLQSQQTFSKYASHITAEAPDVQYISLDDLHFGRGFTFVSDPIANETHKSVTHWIVGHVASRAGLSVIRSALEFILSPAGRSAQFAFLPFFSDTCALQRLWYRLPPSSASDQTKIIEFWMKLLSDSDAVDALLGVSPLHQTQIENSVVELCKQIACETDGVDGIFEASNCPLETLTASDFPGLEMDIRSDLAIVSNGRVIFPLSHCPALHKFKSSSDEELSYCGHFHIDDFVTLQIISAEYQLGQEIQQLLNSTLDESRKPLLSQLTALTASVLRRFHVDTSTDTATLHQLFGRLNRKVMFEKGGQNPKSFDFELEVLLNPLSTTSQKFVPVMRFLNDVFSPKMTVFLHPHSETASMPLMQYYRASLPRLAFSQDGILTNASVPKAQFKDLPENKVLTMNPETPAAWLIEPLQAKLDLDNIRLIDLQEDVLDVVYGLESILFTGSCLDTTARSRRDVYPRGLQLNLGKDPENAEVDTLVMSNLGYFQLKANPGHWHLSLADGRSKELYHIDQEMLKDRTLHVDSAEIEPVTLRFVVDSFAGRQILLRVRKRKGHEAEDVLGLPAQKTDGETSQIADRVLQWVGVKASNPDRKHTSAPVVQSSNWQDCEFPDDPVNVFTIASGHMYERLQKIMILSVLHNTKSCVKFWFIKNYMSPQIKDFLPQFAKKYKFEYGLITYKWPTWLHHQTEKQRRIWAYKILFLDVLFPLNVRKVLFLDSDQIIREDIRLLYDMDIRGAPLAYTPFCDNNKEMDGFRFWKGGFWESHLRGKPYHISALYVVDLLKFRQMAAGDHLRVVYDQLSKDPNSLSNLDQDLPNYTQHEVPIFSLPQEWLWCESWCGNETKYAAKTIDLCNNPLTKEPKLQSARRIVAEWSGFDEEAQRFTSEIERRSLSDPDNPATSQLSSHDPTEL